MARIQSVSKQPVEVVSVAVALAPETDPARIVGYRPGGNWPRAQLSAGEPASEVAARLARDWRSDHPLVADTDWHPRVEPVNFTEHEDGSLSIVYTFAVPLSVTLISSDLTPHQPGDVGPDWFALGPTLPAPPDDPTHTSAKWKKFAERVDDAMRELDPIARLLLEHWRQQVEETTAAFELLPSYFTIPQLRWVYDALWGEQQDPGNFHRWVTKTNEGICIPVDDQTVASKVDAIANRAMLLNGIATVAGNTSAIRAFTRNGLVGASPRALGAAARFAPFAAVGAAAAIAAYQVARNPGKQPTWYKAAHPGERIVLRDLYSPRPLWQTEGITAHPGGH